MSKIWKDKPPSQEAYDLVDEYIQNYQERRSDPAEAERMEQEEQAKFNQRMAQQQKDNQVYAAELMRIACKMTGMSQERITALWQGDESSRPIHREPTKDQIQATRMRLARVPARQSAIAMNPKPTDSVLAVSAFLVDSSQSVLVLSGGVGCGKTVAAATMLREVEGFFINADDILRLAIGDGERWATLCDSAAVVLDDLGTEVTTPATRDLWLSKLDHLVRQIDARMGKLIITTNATPTDFVVAYGARIVDRITGHGRFVEVGGGSMR